MTDKLLFLKDEKKIALLVKANQILNIQKLNINKIIFIYTIPKVGSTSLVTSFRIFLLVQPMVPKRINNVKINKRIENLQYLYFLFRWIIELLKGNEYK